MGGDGRLGDVFLLFFIVCVFFFLLFVFVRIVSDFDNNLFGRGCNGDLVG